MASGRFGVFCLFSNILAYFMICCWASFFYCAAEKPLNKAAERGINLFDERESTINIFALVTAASSRNSIYLPKKQWLEPLKGGSFEAFWKFQHQKKWSESGIRYYAEISRSKFRMVAVFRQ